MTRYFSTTFIINVSDLAELFIDMILKDYNSSTSIIINHRFLFMSSYWSSFCYQLRIKQKLSIAFHSQINDQTEHQNQTLEHYLRCYCNYQQNDWTEWLFTTKFAYNNIIHSSMKIILFFALYRQHSCMLLDIKNDIPREKTNAVNQWEMNSAVNQYLKKLWEMQNQLKKYLQDVTTVQIKYHNQKHKFQIYTIENKILLIMKNLWMIKLSKKLDNQWIEFFKIEEIVRKQAYWLRLSRHYKLIHSMFHVFLFKFYW